MRLFRTLPSEDESFFVKVQDKFLRRQYIGLPPLRWIFNFYVNNVKTSN
jgi:hypothetical protein